VKEDLPARVIAEETKEAEVIKPIAHLTADDLLRKA